MSARMVNKGLVRDFEQATKVLDNGTPKVNNLTLERMGTATLFPLPGSGDTTMGFNIEDIAAQKANQAAEYEAARNRDYDYLMTTPLADLKAAGFFVQKDTDYEANTGGIWRTTTAAERAGMLLPADTVVYLPISWIQLIENQRGTAGALLMKFNEPAIAKNTAGYEPGDTSTGSSTPVVTPIPAVENLPPVTVDNGVPVFNDDPLNTTDLSGSGGTGAQTLASLAGGGKYWWLWYVIAIAIVIIYIKFIRK